MATAAYDASMGDMDIIFAGGGTVACVAAGRLAKANPDLKILLIEGGKNNLNDATVTHPALYLAHLAPDSKTAIVSWLYKLNISLIGGSTQRICHGDVQLMRTHRFDSFTRQNLLNILEVEKLLSLWEVCSVVDLRSTL
jgi:choline dehydrogenase-like flavoprotein